MKLFNEFKENYRAELMRSTGAEHTGLLMDGLSKRMQESRDRQGYEHGQVNNLDVQIWNELSVLKARRMNDVALKLDKRMKVVAGLAKFTGCDADTSVLLYGLMEFMLEFDGGYSMGGETFVNIKKRSGKMLTWTGDTRQTYSRSCRYSAQHGRVTFVVRNEVVKQLTPDVVYAIKQEVMFRTKRKGDYSFDFDASYLKAL